MQVNPVVLQSSTKTVVCLKASFQQVMISTRRSTWPGSLFTWQLPPPAEEAPLQEEEVAVKTKWWWGTPLTWKPAHRFVPRASPIPTATVRFLSTEKKARPIKMERWWGRSTTTNVTVHKTGAVRLLAPTKVLRVPPFISASAAAEHKRFLGSWHTEEHEART